MVLPSHRIPLIFRSSDDERLLLDALAELFRPDRELLFSAQLMPELVCRTSKLPDLLTGLLDLRLGLFSL